MTEPGLLTRLIEAFLSFVSSWLNKPTPTPVPTPTPDPVTPATRRVTKDDNFRTLPTITKERMREITKGYPFEAESDAIWEAVKGRPLPLAQSWMESRYGQDANAQRTKNPLGLLWYDGSPIPYFNAIDAGGGVVVRLLRFRTWADAFKEWARRVDDPSYKNSVYAQGMTLEQYIFTFVGGPGCISDATKCGNGETQANIRSYLTETIARYNRYLNVTPTTTTPPPPGAITFGRVPKPANYEERIIAPGVNTAWDNLGPRIPRGLVLHRMLGTLAGTDSYFRGAAKGSACTDFGIGQGKVYRWTKPGANVAPWASGPANGIDGDGTAFWNEYKSDPIGVSIFNRDCLSIEIEGLTYDDPVPPQDYARLVELVAWQADAWLNIPWNQWPINNDGVHCLLAHAEITDDKICPGPVVYGLVSKLIEDVGVRLRSYQS